MENYCFEKLMQVYPKAQFLVKLFSRLYILFTIYICNQTVPEFTFSEPIPTVGL